MSDTNTFVSVQDFYDSSPELEQEIQAAYDLHGKVYDGNELTDEEQAEYDRIVHKLLDMGRIPFGISLWLIYASKYVKS